MRLVRLTPLLALPAFVMGSAVASAASSSGIVAGVPAATGIRDLGRTPVTMRISIAISLPYRHHDELERLVDSQGDPGSPSYHHFLSRSQFDAYFSPEPRAYGRVLASLKSAGFTITRVYSNRSLLDAAAPTRTIERYFSTEIHRVAQSGQGIRYWNVRPAIAPPDVRDLVAGVTGLDNVGRFHTANHFAHARGAASVRPYLAVPGQIFGPDYGYGPTAFIDAYKIPTKTAVGKGQASGVVIDADFLDSDLAAYLANFGVYRSGPPTVRVPIDGGPPPGLGSGDSVETTLDVETIVSIAPGTSLYVYEFPDFTNPQTILDAYEQVVTDDFVGTANSSFGGCETQFGQNGGFAQMSNQIALQGAALGITFHASTGDSGNQTFGCPSTSVSSPASDPYFSAIGGTSLYLNPSSGKVEHEYGWGGLGNFGATGGGVSVIWPLPRYQHGIPNIIASGRNIPDVSFDADPATGESFYYAGNFVGPIGGTSLSSPIFGAAQTITNQLRGSEGGFVNPALYGAFRKYGNTYNGGQIFRDITVGNNGFYPAKRGYDQMTGIGAEIVSNLAGVAR